MFKNILVPVDGSASAHKAVDIACDLASRYAAELTVLHVLEDAGSPRIPRELRQYAELEHVWISEMDVRRSASEEVLQNARIRARDRGQERVATQTEVGDPATTILAYAKDHGIDLIVMGSRGLGDLKGLLMGSVSNKVAQIAQCTCVTVK